MEHVNILEAAQFCGVSDKTIRRAIHKGLLPARFPKPNRCEIALSDLERFTSRQISGHVQVSVEERIAALERRVQGLEQQVQDLLNQLETAQPRRTSRRTERLTGTLPRNLVALLAFARLHGMPETKVLAHASRDTALFPVKRGEWIDHDGTVVKEALDTKGRKAFYQLYHELPYFLRCGQCPHGYLDTV
jgi:polyhydroxyalkanoate synthesis regulator phasin